MYVCQPYDDALKNIIENGVKKTNRTGVETLAVFGIQSRYRIDDRFPLLTGRRLSFKAMVGELLWFISGSTNNEDLKALGCNFWTPWVDEEFEKKYGYASGSFGPIYGFQLRHFGGVYGNGIGGIAGTQEKLDPMGLKLYGTGGFDQLANMVNTLKTNPDCRRNLFSLWNPTVLQEMRLPPCHYTFQCFVHNGKLSGKLTQRSCDFPIGVPFNIAFYSAFIYLLAQQSGLEPYEFIHDAGDSHIYVDQLDAVNEYLDRPKPDSPILNVSKAEDIDSYTVEDFELVDYHPESKMKIPVAI